MTVKQVKWVLVIRYGKAAHGATYGRLGGGNYTKDYIQLSKRPDFISDLEAAFPKIGLGNNSIPIEFQWPTGSEFGTLFRQSADRPHLAWGTNSAPSPWKMSLKPSVLTVETILGDPTHTTVVDADRELENLIASDFGQPFLIAVKLAEEAQKLHLRVLVDAPNPDFDWASLDLAPQIIQDLAHKTSQNSAIAWKLFNCVGSGSELYFDPGTKVGAWADKPSTKTTIASKAALTEETILPKVAVFSEIDSDAYAEAIPFSNEEVSAFAELIESGIYSVANSTATVKTRGSAQKAFADVVKRNYDYVCAITGIGTREFLIASHIVPWSVDASIRLDPSNGICLSVFVDRAFEYGFLVLNNDLTVKVDWEKVGTDSSLRDALLSLDGWKLTEPKADPPRPEYLQKRRELNSV